MNIESLISQAAGEAVKALYGMDANEKMLQLQKTRSEFEGNLTPLSAQSIARSTTPSKSSLIKSKPRSAGYLPVTS